MGFNIGSFMGGAANGAKFGLDLQDAINKRKMQESLAKRVGDARAKLANHEAENQQLINQPSNDIEANNADVQVENIDQSSADNTPINQNLLSNSINPISQSYDVAPKFAEGGLVDASSLGLDSASMANPKPVPMVNQALQPQAQPTTPQPTPQAQQQKPLGLDSAQAKAPTPQQRKAYYSRAAIDKELYDGLTDDAIKYGDGQAAAQYFKASFDVSQKMIKDNVANAQREFEQFGDLSSYKDLYNHAYPDGRQITNIGKDDKGNFTITSQGSDGKPESGTYSLDQIKTMLMHFGDTEGLWKAQAASAAERQKQINETDSKIKVETAKGFNLSAGEAHFDSTGKRVAINEKPKDIGLDNMFDAERAAADPTNPNHQLGLDILENSKKRDIEKSAATKTPDFDEQAYAEEKARNPSLTRLEFKRQIANLKDDKELLDSVTTKTNELDKYGNELSSTTRTTKVKPVVKSDTKPTSPAYQAYLERYNKFKDNPEAIAKLNAIAKSKGIIK